MSFEWLDYLGLARTLAGDAGEACHRSAISRAYYAAFHVARRYVSRTQPDFSPKKAGEDHFHVWDRLKKSVKRQERAAGITGKKLHDARVRADYELVGLRFPQAAKDALNDADAVMRSLEALEQGN
jgi:uncharacterized protein (UPF0332 family)